MPILVKYLFCIIYICNKMSLLQKYRLCIVNIYMKCKYRKNVDIRLEILAVKLGIFFSNSGQYWQGVNTQIFIYLYFKNIILIFLKLLIFYSYILKTRLFIIKYILLKKEIERWPRKKIILKTWGHSCKKKVSVPAPEKIKYSVS